MPIRKKLIIKFLSLFFAIFGLLPHSTIAQDTDSVLSRSISIKQQKASIYQILSQISDSINYYFAYDSRLVDNNRKISIKATTQPLQDLLRTILNDSALTFKTIENHIVISHAVTNGNSAETIDSKPESTIIFGRILDYETREPLAQANILLKNNSIGTVTNKDGIFRITFPDTLKINQVRVSHLGYKPKILPVKAFAHNRIDIFLEPEQISIPEVIVRSVDAETLIKEAIERIPQNYSQTPLYLQSFYREGVLMREKYMYYLESVFKVYKTPYSKNRDADMAKQILTRRIDNRNHTDTLFAKLRGGMHSALTLDIVREFPNFFEPEAPDFYDYWRNDIVLIDNRPAYEIGFRQKTEVRNPLYRGVLYIDIESLAIVGADFELHPQFIEKTTQFFIPKRNPRYRIAADKIQYSVRYQRVDKQYILSHVRGDLNFQYRKRRGLINHSFKVFFEMVTTDMDTANVKPFDKKETHLSKRVLYDNHTYSDPLFWEGYNTITPEESIFNALTKLKNKTEEIGVGTVK
jgi:hypothetical protein